MVTFEVRRRYWLVVSIGSSTKTITRRRAARLCTAGARELESALVTFS